MTARTAVWMLGWLVVGGCEGNVSCSTSSLTLEAASIETFLRDSLTPVLGGQPKVTCPSTIKAKKGARFECLISLDGVDAVGVVEQKDGGGNVELVETRGVILLDKLEQQLVAKYGAALGGQAKADCGGRLRRSTPGDLFRCQVTAEAGGAATFEVEVKGEDGRVSIRPVEPAAGATTD